MIGLALTLAMAPAGVAPPASIPDSSALAELRAASSEWNRFHVVTTRGTFTVTALRLEPGGLVIQEPRRRSAVLVSADAPRDSARRLIWPEIERIEGMRSRGLRGALVGAVAGGLLGLAAKETFQGELHDASEVAIVAIPIGAVLGGIVGATVGSTTGWRRLYPHGGPR